MDLEYGLKTLKNLDKAVLEKWYPFSKAKERQDELLEIVKLRKELSGDFIISDDHKYFKRIEMPTERLKIPNTGEITYSIQWREDTGELTEKEKNLPDPEWKSYSKAQWDKLIGRKV